MKLKELFESSETLLNIIIDVFLAVEIQNNQKHLLEAALINYFPNTKVRYNGDEWLKINIPTKDKSQLSSDIRVKELEKLVKTILSEQEIRLITFKMSVEIDGEVNFPIACKLISLVKVKLAKHQKITGIEKYLHDIQSFRLVVEHGWVGGLLSILKIKGLKREAFVGYGILSDNYTKVFEIITKHIGGDVWDCQEELEQDKSTKPFASE
jgi:hypothetical protein